MGSFRQAHFASKQGTALLIVLALVVLLTGVSVAYLSRTTGDRQVAHASFSQSKGDELAASAMNLVIGDFQREIANGSSPCPSPVPTHSPLPIPLASPFVYPYSTSANAMPL